ncbi:hypothetical protein DDE18_00960 [Nocardioides gansuensis]|uniref:DUF4282 domain-containing protein n=1 Tax=Nocardioides gansuensis TaxID=2138300 RepID=A0A2T8FEW6_9ACTN|nr:DUF4282 domain-containing protein [Nocardioides gansuensis]PVG84239.1 hypothetical protein DDE18_00960 [Nocardioides gansuensis]
MSHYGNTPQDPYGQSGQNPYGQQPDYSQQQPAYYGGIGQQPPKKGFFGALFDFGFNTFITPMVVKVVYVIGLVAMVLAFFVLLVGAFSQDAMSGIAVLILGPIVLLLYLCLFRMMLEFYVAVVRMSEDIHERLPRS